MSIIGLALKNIKGNRFRSLVIFLCLTGVVIFLLVTTLVIRGTQQSLNAGIQRLGADIIVVPEGADTKVETALLTGKPATAWMKRDKMAEIARIPGVSSVSPQIYLQSLFGASCCSSWEVFLVVYDPTTDFTISPWLKQKLGRELAKGEVIGGRNIFLPPDSRYIKLYGYNLTLTANLEATGTGIDETIFFTLDTAYDIARSSLTTAERPLNIPSDSISAVMIKVDQGIIPHNVALQIMLDVPGVIPLESPDLFSQVRKQIDGLIWGFTAFLGISWVVSAVLIGLIFSMAAHERRRDIAVLRAIGATRVYILRSILTEAGLLALAASILGIVLSSAGVYLFSDFIITSLGLPFLFPGAQVFLILVVTGIIFSLGTVLLAVLVPAFRVSRQEPALAMRE